MRRIKLSPALLCLLSTITWVGITRAQSQSGYAYHESRIVKSSIELPGESANQNENKLINVLKELNKEKGVYFMFSDQSLGNVSVNPVVDMKEKVEVLLDKVLKNTGLTYKKVNSNTFVILSTKPIDKSQTDLNNLPELQTIVSLQNPAMEFAIGNITGKVTDKAGNGVAAVTVTVKGKKKAVTTDANGNFSIDAQKGDVLVFTSVGFNSSEVTIGDNTSVAVQLTEKAGQLNEVVVTALGISHKTKDLTYATQKLNNADLTTVKDANFVNSLSGKVAGVTINKSASGMGGSARVVLRGNKSTQNNAPLYVIDGIPLANFSPAQPGDVWGQSSGAGSSGRDGGDGISNINPDDIESITILKGASGAALYGSQAANGAIVITTKSGKAGRTRINFSSDITAEKPMYYPELQFKYGQGLGGVAAADTTNENSWGPVVNAPDHVKPFFQTGLTTVNSLSLAGGNEKAQTYFSYSNTTSKGIEPTSSFNRNNLNFRETAKFLNDKLTADANISFLDQVANNRPVSGLYSNPLTGLELFPRGLNFDQYKNGYQYFSTLRNVNLQNWFDINYEKGFTGQDHEQNPYWLINRTPRVDKRDRVVANLSLKYKLTDWLNIQARGNADKSWDIYESKMYAGTQSVQSAPNGRYTYDNTVNSQYYGDLILMANKNLDDNFNLQANLGTSITDTKIDDLNFDTNPNDVSGLWYANKFGVQFITPSAMLSNQTLAHKQQQAIFGSAQLGFKNFLFVDLAGRNDWSSTFAYTPTSSKGYFYYSAGANLILSEALKLPTPISFAKVRVSYAKVGNDVPVYITNPPQYTMNNQQGAQVNSKAPLPGTYLQPEDNRSFEVGTEWRFLHDKVGIDITYYKNNNFRQYMEIPAPLGSGFNTYYLNLGNIQNRGFEITAFVVPVQTRDLKWTSTLNFSTNKNLVVKLSDANIPGADATNGFIITGQGVNMYQSEVKEGGSWGDIYGSTFQRNPKDGSIYVDATGKPQQNSTFTKVGNPFPDFTLGWNNSFDIGNFTVNFLIDGRFGGKVMSVTQAVLDEYGDSKASGAARDAGGVNMKATVQSTGQAWVGLLPAQAFYKGVGDRNGISENYMYDATAVRLRELAVGYKIPVRAKWITDLRLSVIGRNLFFFSKKAPFDPELSMATNNGLQGIETFSQPSTRSLGASLKVTF